MKIRNIAKLFLNLSVIFLVCTALVAVTSPAFALLTEPYVAASFTVDKPGGYAPLTIGCTDTSTGYPSPSSWQWNFGDGSANETARNPSHTYAAAGTYTITLTVRNCPGATSTATMTYKVCQPKAPPVAEFSGTPLIGCAPLEVQFLDESTGAPTAWSWDFGDGGRSALQHPVHLYMDPGVYTVSLSVTNGDETDDMVRTVYVNVMEPIPSPTPTPFAPWPHQSIQLPQLSGVSYIFENGILKWIITGGIGSPIIAPGLFIWDIVPALIFV